MSKHMRACLAFVGWALKAFGSSVRNAATAFADTCVYDHTQELSSDDDGAPAHGVASPTFRRNLRNAAIDEVILPLKTRC